MKIKSLSFTSFKFFENTQIVCQKEDGSVFQWTILLGNNNTGKTSLLKAIADLRPITLDLQITTKKHLSTKEALQQFIPAGLTANIGSDSNPMEISCTTTLPNLKQWKYSTHGATVSSTPTIDNIPDLCLRCISIPLKNKSYRVTVRRLRLSILSRPKTDQH